MKGFKLIVSGSAILGIVITFWIFALGGPSISRIFHALIPNDVLTIPDYFISVGIILGITMIVKGLYRLKTK